MRERKNSPSKAFECRYKAFGCASQTFGCRYKAFGYKLLLGTSTLGSLCDKIFLPMWQQIGLGLVTLELQREEIFMAMSE